MKSILNAVSSFVHGSRSVVWSGETGDEWQAPVGRDRFYNYALRLQENPLREYQSTYYVRYDRRSMV